MGPCGLYNPAAVGQSAGHGNPTAQRGGDLCGAAALGLPAGDWTPPTTDRICLGEGRESGRCAATWLPPARVARMDETSPSRYAGGSRRRAAWQRLRRGTLSSPPLVWVAGRLIVRSSQHHPRNAMSRSSGTTHSGRSPRDARNILSNALRVCFTRVSWLAPARWGVRTTFSSDSTGSDGDGGSVGNTSSPAPAMRLLTSASCKAGKSITGPRLQLISTAWGCR